MALRVTSHATSPFSPDCAGPKPLPGGVAGKHDGAVSTAMTGARERRGLTAPEVAAGLRRDGPNVLPAYRPPSPVLLLARQMTHFFALLLRVAAGLAYLGGMPQLAAAVVVVAGIAALTRQAHRRPGPLALQLRLAVMIIAVIAVSVGVVFFGVAIGLGMPRITASCWRCE